MAALAASPVLLLSWFVVGDTTPGLYRGGFLVAALGVAVVIMAATQPGPNPLRDVLSWTPLVTIGVLSYGLYLWHWPLYLVINTDSTGLQGAPLLTVRLTATVLAAVASYHLVEMPVRERAAALADRVGIGDKLRRSTRKLSQGERQRVAVCRAILPEPEVLLADEPTGNLDPANKDLVLDILFDYAGERGITLLTVTHDHGVLDRFDRVIDVEEWGRA